MMLWMTELPPFAPFFVGALLVQSAGDGCNNC